MKPIVIIESPYGSADPEIVKRNRLYLDYCLRDSLNRGEVPIASHKLYTDALDDNIPAQRQLGIEAGFVLHSVAERQAFYVDLGTSTGMNFGRLAWADLTKPQGEIRTLPPGMRLAFDRELTAKGLPR